MALFEHGAIAGTKLLSELRSARVVNTDYPDYNLVFVPLRHLVAQGEVEDRGMA